MLEESGPSCGLCAVEVAGADELVVSCATEVKEAMVVVTNNECIKATR